MKLPPRPTLIIAILIAILLTNCGALTANPPPTLRPEDDASVTQVSTVAAPESTVTPKAVDPNIINGQTIYVLSCSTDSLQIKVDEEERSAAVDGYYIWNVSQEDDDIGDGDHTDGVSHYVTAEVQSDAGCPIGLNIWKYYPEDKQVSLFEYKEGNEKDKEVDVLFDAYLSATPIYKSTRHPITSDMKPDSESKCNVMLSNVWQISGWGAKEYARLLSLCRNKTDNNLSIGHLLAVKGMSSFHRWGNGAYTMAFMSQPDNGEVIGTITPCGENLPKLSDKFYIASIDKANDDFSIHNWSFASANVLYVTLNLGGMSIDGLGVVKDTYLGFTLPGENPNLLNWQIGGTDTFQGQIYLYKVVDCPN